MEEKMTIEEKGYRSIVVRESNEKEENTKWKKNEREKDIFGEKIE